MKILKTILVLLNLTPIYSFVSSNLIRRPSLNIFKKSNSFKLKEKPNTEYKNITINNNSNNLNNLNNLNISNNSNNLNNTNNTNIVAQKHNVVNTKITGFLKISRSNNILSTLFFIINIFLKIGVYKFIYIIDKCITHCKFIGKYFKLKYSLMLSKNTLYNNASFIDTSPVIRGRLGLFILSNSMSYMSFKTILADIIKIVFIVKIINFFE